MNIYKTNLFPYIIGDSLIDKTITVTMDNVRIEEMQNNRGKKEEKYVLYFRETDKGLILNKTNSKTIAKLYGAETDQWSGMQITLYGEKVKAFGETHDVVRVAPAKPAPAKSNGKKADSQPALVDVPEQVEPVTYE